MTKKRARRMVTAWTCQCERCGHKWEGIGPQPPAACAGCKSRYWDIPRGTLKRGPKPKKGR